MSKKIIDTEQDQVIYRLKCYIADNCLKKKDMAEKLNVTPTYLSSILTRRKKLSDHLKFKVIRYLEIH